MSVTQQESENLLRSLGLPTVEPPVVFTSAEQTLGHRHGSAMRVGFTRLGIAGYYCVEGVPTVAVLIGPVPDDELRRVHQGLWNQGIASALAVVQHQAVQIYSLSRRPRRAALTPAEADARLIETLDLVKDSLAFIRLLSGVRTGRWFVENARSFPREERVDELLLANLEETERRLVALRMPRESARALLIQTLFIAYLEDRELIRPAYLHRTFGKDAGLDTWLDVLKAGKPQLLGDLFEQLHQRFNGNVFYGPCAFGPQDRGARLTREHLKCLVDFREGKMRIESGELRFWPYDFKFIPVELISAIYDRLLVDNGDRRKMGSYFTPHFLAEFSVNEAWRELPETVRAQKSIVTLDAACGSGIFLVLTFKRICEERRSRGETLDWSELKRIVKSLYGVDPQAAAVRLAIFSLYIAMLEEMEGRLPGALEKERPVFPKLWDESLFAMSFFGKLDAIPPVQLAISNPPWSSRASKIKDAVAWCTDHGRPIPSKDSAWAFVWKLKEHIAGDGVMALLLPAMGMLHNHTDHAQDARRLLFSELDVKRIIDFSDISFQLFPKAKRPTVLMLATQPNWIDNQVRVVDYLCPKVTRIFNFARVIVVEAADRHRIRVDELDRETESWKRRLWASGRDRRLLDRLGGYRKLGELITGLKAARPAGLVKDSWVIGQGFKPAVVEQLDNPDYVRYDLPAVRRLPLFPARSFIPFAVSADQFRAHDSEVVHRRGFFEAFTRPKILIPQGVMRDEQRLRAAYTDDAMTFEDSLQAITFPEGQESTAMFLTVLLNSSLFSWFLFHTSANWGTDRAKVDEEQLLDLPFPTLDELHDERDVVEAYAAAERLIKGALDEVKKPLHSPFHDDFRKQADEIVFKYFGLTDSERTLIEDGLTYVMPSMQPKPNDTIPLRRSVSAEVLTDYAKALKGAMAKWLTAGDANITIWHGHADLIVAEVAVGDVPDLQDLKLLHADALETLNKLRQNMPQFISEQIAMVPDLAVWHEDRLVFIKPNEFRYWMRSSALNDADSIARSITQAAAEAQAH